MVKIERGSDFGADRYKYDTGMCSYRKGWAQVDTNQDAWYYGNWTNPTTRQLFSYVEGDTCLTTCDSDEEYVTCLRQIREWHNDNGVYCRIDPGLDPNFKQKFINMGLEDLLWPNRKENKSR